jgi:hypothetical protein
VITADTITDEQIRELLARGAITVDLAVETGARLNGGMWYAPASVRNAARARCAEILNARQSAEKEGLRLRITEETDRLVFELLDLGQYRGWRFSYEYPGLFCYSHPGCDRRVFFTPDWSEDGEMPIEVQDDEGTCVDFSAISLPLEGRTGQKLFDLVRPTLDKIAPSKEAP